MEAHERPLSDDPGHEPRTGADLHSLEARVLSLATPGRSTVAGVYAGFDRRSQLAAADVAERLVHAGCRVHILRAVAVSPLPEVRHRQQRLAAQCLGSKFNVVVDACPSPCKETLALADLLGVPYLTAHG